MLLLFSIFNECHTPQSMTPMKLEIGFHFPEVNGNCESEIGDILLNQFDI